MAACDSKKYFKKAAYDPENCSERPSREKEMLKQTFDAAFGTIFRISKCFQRSKQKLFIYFSP